MPGKLKWAALALLLQGWQLATAQPAPAGMGPAAKPVYKDRGGTLLIGDSMMRVGVGPVLRNALERRLGPPVHLKAKSSTGLSRPDFYDWPHAARELLKEAKYHSVVMFIGANDCQAVSDSGLSHRFDSGEWRRIYAERLRQISEILCGGERQVYWLGLPPMRAKGFNQRIQKLTEFTRKELSSNPCIRWVNIEEAVSNAGHYTDKLKVGKRRIKLREADGIHLTAEAGEQIAKVVLAAMEK